MRIFKAYWEEGKDISDRSVLNSIAEELGLSTNLFDEPEAKEKLFDQTKKAHDRGVFGVPTMANETRLWWGQDRMHLVAESLGETKKEFPSGTYQTPCALIIGKRKESTDEKTSLNDALRSFGVDV